MFTGAQAELRRSMELLSSIQDVLNESCAVTITDTDGYITYVNDWVHKKLEYADGTIIGKHFGFAIVSGQEDVMEDIFSCLNDGRRWKGDIVLKTHSGKGLLFHTSAIPIGPQSRVDSQFVFISGDVTSQRQEEVYAREVELEREMWRNSDKLTLAGQIASSVVHEIRNPLTSLRGFTQLIHGLISDSHVQTYCNIMLEEFERLNTMLDEFLLLAKPATILRKPTNIAMLMNEVLALILPAANEKNLLMDYDCGDEDTLIECVPNDLKQAFINILKNSVEATPSGGEITVTVVQTNSQVHVHFKDQGCGIAKESLSRLGEPFYTTKENGTGLGLMVTYGIIQDHGGQINIQSEERLGTEIEVVLPRWR